LTWINRGIIISAAIVFLLIYVIPKFKRSLYSRKDYLVLYIEIIVILFSTIYWYFWLQLK
jgi:type II secretory pathway component PulF